MRYLKRWGGLVIGSFLIMGCVAGCTYRPKYIMFPVERYHFITSAGDSLVRAGQEEVTLPVDGVWMGMGELEKLEDAQEYAVERGYIVQ